MTIVRPTLLAALVVALTAIDARPATAQVPVDFKLVFPLARLFGEPDPPEPPPAYVVENDANERALVDRALKAWHAASTKMPVFSVSYTLYEYDPIFNPPARDESETPIRSTRGTIRYAAPDKASWESDDGERWHVTGDAVIEFNKTLKKVREYRRSKEEVGKPVTDCPFPFLYGPDPELMRRRFHLWPIASEGRTNELWLEAYPKTNQDRTFARAQFILKLPEHQLMAVNLIHHNERQRMSVVFEKMEPPASTTTSVCTLNLRTVPVGWTHELADDGVTGVPQWLIGPRRTPKKGSPQ